MSDPLHIRTPLVRCERTGAAIGRPVLLKMESAQPSGSFKLRGIGHLCRRLVEGGAPRLVASSGGNAGYSAAWAARALGVPITVVVPGSTPEWMGERFRSLGAELLVRGAVWDEAHAHALRLAHGKPDCYVHPFDHPLIWEGHASLVEELAEQTGRPGSIVVAIGGGGLLCGVALGLSRVGWDDVPIIAVETRGADSYAAALRAGRPVPIDGIRSIAKTLGAITVSAEAFSWSRRRPVHSVVLPDALAVDACFRFLDDHRTLVEPSCGAGLAAVYFRPDALPEGPVVVVVCGGVVVTLDALGRWREDARHASSRPS